MMRLDFADKERLVSVVEHLNFGWIVQVCHLGLVIGRQVHAEFPKSKEEDVACFFVIPIHSDGDLGLVIEFSSPHIGSMFAISFASSLC